MRSGIVVIALVLLTTACGNSSPPVAESSTDRLQLEVVVAPDPLVSGQPATVGLVVTNVSDRRALLTFDTTQRGDVSFSTGGVEVYRWSELRAFALDRERYAFVPGQRVRFPLEADPLPVGPGEYEVLATVTGVPKLRTVRTTVTVVGAASESPSAGATATPTEEVSGAVPAFLDAVRPLAAG